MHALSDANLSQISVLLWQSLVSGKIVTRVPQSDAEITGSLIPNLSYISEAAACLLDRQLRTYLVPYTDVVHLASKAFHYDYWDRRAFYRKHKPLPPKVGSFQVFLQGYQGDFIYTQQSHKC